MYLFFALFQAGYHTHDDGGTNIMNGLSTMAAKDPQMDLIIVLCVLKMKKGFIYTLIWYNFDEYNKCALFDNVCCSVLQCVLHTATHCNTLQHTLQHTATHSLCAI